MGGIGMGFSWFFWIALVVVLIVVIGRVYKTRSGYPKPGDESIDILKERYARGEIDKAEFEAKKKDLMD
jgi:putative membrane protein